MRYWWHYRTTALPHCRRPSHLIDPPGRPCHRQCCDNIVPPAHQLSNTATDIVQALYKFGGPQLQFECRTAAGVLQISGLSAKGICHFHLKMVFTEPTMNQTGAGRAALDWVV